MIVPWTSLAGSKKEERSDRVRAVALRQHTPIIIHERHGRNTSSFNWSGYAVTGVNDSVSDVKASWKVPAIQGACSSQNQYASFWVGIDGYNSNTVEQIGTDSDCQNGLATYYAWYEFYPHFPYNIPMTIKPGDVMSAEVSYSGGKFTVSITDVSTGRTWFTSQKIPNAKRSSAEWIIEAPSSGGILPLANFGTVDFGQHYTHISATCDATVGGASGPVGSAAFGASLVEITMVASDGTTVMSQPSGLLTDEESFTDAWENVGP
jgi:hypothetical protein